MKIIPLELKENSYEILIGNQVLDSLPKKIKALKLGKDAVIISDKTVSRLHGQRVAKVLRDEGFVIKTFVVPPGEKSKSGPVALKLIEDIARYDVGRKIFIIALGGGVIGDLAGFVAAIYKRGIPYIQVPTTLLAQIDSAIGGKVAVDLAVGKNLAGAFYQPKMVFTDISFLKTLDARQIRNGLAEAVKYGIIVDKQLFVYLEKSFQDFLNLDEGVLQRVVETCSRIKASVVSKDEKESGGLRMILNFGHTLGHAIENAAAFRYHHGEAVAIGMRMAAHISVLKGMLLQKDDQRINALLSSIGLPDSYAGLLKSQIIASMNHDKKFIAAQNRFVLARSIGRVEIVSGVEGDLIDKAIKQFKK
ncbi:MAG: 3-dehydroquinate synthase [Candidatus Omnitrophica bacterium]|nr:3-dehydroquinate synthase [Candidatus Omnitrophota bacterium]